MKFFIYLSPFIFLLLLAVIVIECNNYILLVFFISIMIVWKKSDACKNDSL